MRPRPAASDRGSRSREARLPGDREHAAVGRPHGGVLDGETLVRGDECWKPAFARYLIPKQTGLRRELETYLRDYNADRAHNGRYTQGRTPDIVLGKAKMFTRP